MRRVSRAVVSLVVAGSLLVLVAALPPRARGTDVPGGTISVDTAWSRAGSPYVIRGEVNVASGAVLAIGPGVDVQFAGNHSLGGGFVYVNGTREEPVTFRPQSDTGRPWQWGHLVVNQIRGALVRGAFSVETRGWGSAAGDTIVEGCTIELGYMGLQVIGVWDVRIADVTIRQSETVGLALGATDMLTAENITIDHAWTGVELSHQGSPWGGPDPDSNILRHVTVSHFTDGIVPGAGAFPLPTTNLLTESVFRDGGVVFPGVFPGHVYGNSFVNTIQDFGFPAASGTGYYDGGSRGNYWSNYHGADGDGDGIGDTPYGPDRYPLMAPVPGAGASSVPEPPAQGLDVAFVAGIGGVLVVVVAAAGLVLWRWRKRRGPPPFRPPETRAGEGPPGTQ